MPEIPNLTEKFGLDFDDAYQYCVANRLEVPIVSFDDDFDEGDIQRFTPEQALAEDGPL